MAQLVARQMDYLANGGAYASHSPGITAVGALYEADAPVPLPEGTAVEGRAVYTNCPTAGASRGYGAVQSLFALNCQMDEVAGPAGNGSGRSHAAERGG